MANTNTNTITNTKKYMYEFGIDSIGIGYSTIDESTCYMSEEIDIGFLNKNDYIQLSADYSNGENGSIEFYIIDVSDPKPILPIEDKIIVDEKVFHGIDTRFSINQNEKVVIKKNGIISDTSIENVIDSNEKGYTVSYTPVNPYNLKVSSTIIKVKAILRSYDINSITPHIKSITIRRFGGEATWKQ